MAVCPHCNGEMKEGISCRPDPIIIGDAAYEPIRWGDERNSAALGHRLFVSGLRHSTGRRASSRLLRPAMPGLPRPGPGLRMPCGSRRRGLGRRWSGDVRGPVPLRPRQESVFGAPLPPALPDLVAAADGERPGPLRFGWGPMPPAGKIVLEP